MDLLNQFGEPMQDSPNPGMPAVITPQPFSLSICDENDLKKIRDEIMDKERAWENGLNTFFSEWAEEAQSWRVLPRDMGSKKPKGMFNSKSAETHRATETMATLWFRMLTASDNFYQAVAMGLGPNGQPLQETDLYAVERVIMAQLRFLRFKEKLLRSLRSLAIFGTAIFEEPWVIRATTDGSTYFEGTDFVHRSLIQTGFDTTVMDLDMSDYIFTVDYPTSWRLRDWARMDPESWDRAILEKELQDESWSSNATSKYETGVFNRLSERRQRAGYTTTDKNIRELLSYHGKIDTENDAILKYWESLGREDQPNTSDFSFGLLDGAGIVKMHMTQYKTWRSKFKTASYKLFECEALGYGVGRIGKKAQRELDVTTSRMNDLLMFALYSMWKVGRYAGLKANQLNIKPWNIIELEDINQLEQIKPDMQAISQALAMQAIQREDFRTSSGANTNLQAVATAGTATEASLAQNEAMRGGSVHAEIIGETLIREHLMQMHINNLDYLDSQIYVAITGEQKPQFYDRKNLPKNIGFEIRITTDKNFRPERAKQILEGLQMATSIRNVVPGALNVIAPLFEEWFRTLDLNPRLLHQPQSMQQQLMDGLRKAQAQGLMPGGPQSTAAEAGGEMAGSGAQVTQPTPVGPVPGSANIQFPVQTSA